MNAQAILNISSFDDYVNYVGISCITTYDIIKMVNINPIVAKYIQPDLLISKILNVNLFAYKYKPLPEYKAAYELLNGNDEYIEEFIENLKHYPARFVSLLSKFELSAQQLSRLRKAVSGFRYTKIISKYLDAGLQESLVENGCSIRHMDTGIMNDWCINRAIVQNPKNLMHVPYHYLVELNDEQLPILSDNKYCSAFFPVKFLNVLEADYFSGLDLSDEEARYLIHILGLGRFMEIFQNAKVVINLLTQPLEFDLDVIPELIPVEFHTVDLYRKLIKKRLINHTSLIYSEIVTPELIVEFISGEDPQTNYDNAMMFYEIANEETLYQALDILKKNGKIYDGDELNYRMICNWESSN